MKLLNSTEGETANDPLVATPSAVCPLTPRECSLQEFPFMPVDVQRLLKSDTWVLATGEEKAAAMSLWLESWHQVPAASLPKNDRMLGHLSQCRNWGKVKLQAMRGWVLCSDGRYYHPVVAEKALEAWIEKLLAGVAGASGNAKRWGIVVDVAEGMTQLATAIRMLQALAPRSKALKKKAVVSAAAGIPPGSATEYGPESAGKSGGDRNRHRQGEGEGEGPCHLSAGAPAATSPTTFAATAQQKTDGSTADRPAVGGHASRDAPTSAAWRAYAAEFKNRYGIAPERNKQTNGQLANLLGKVSKEDVPNVIAFYVGHMTSRYYLERRHPIDTFCRDYHGIRTQWAQQREGFSAPPPPAPESHRAQRMAGFAGHAAAGASPSIRPPISGELAEVENCDVRRIQR